MDRIPTLVLVVNDSGEILCLRRHPDDEDRPGQWDFPGGCLDPGEDVTQTVMREAQEEAGLTLKHPTLIYGKSDTRPWGVGAWVFFLERVTGHPVIKLSPEHTEYQWLTPQALLAQHSYPLHRELLAYVAVNGLFDCPRAQIGVTARALITNATGQILVIRRGASDPFKPGKWDIPGGRVEDGESIQAAVIRETAEEVGIALTRPRLVYVVSGVRPHGSGSWLFYAEKVSANVTPKLGDEHDRYMWIDFADLPKCTDYQILLSMHSFVSTHGLL
jgi:8-oxo-dGTP diphosphatase